MLDNGACSEVHVINSSESGVNSGIEVIERGVWNVYRVEVFIFSGSV